MLMPPCLQRLPQPALSIPCQSMTHGHKLFVSIPILLDFVVHAVQFVWSLCPWQQPSCSAELSLTPALSLSPALPSVSHPSFGWAFLLILWTFAIVAFMPCGAFACVPGPNYCIRWLFSGFMREPFSFAPLRLEPVQIGSQLSLILHRASQAKVLDLPGKACFLW